jgi:3-oxoacyl-[acyl-carrier-protein] synthase-1
MMRVAVTAAGMVTPVGFNYASSCAAIRAGISGIREANLWDAESGEYLTAGKVDLPHWWEGIGKLADLVAPAIHECFERAGGIKAREIPILLGVASPDRPCRLEGLDEQILDEVEFRLEVPHHPSSKVIPRGNVSGTAAIQEARQLMGRGLVPACIVAGVDSYLQQSVMEAYMEERRILTPPNSNGFIPGEAGCAVLVEPAGARHRDELEILGVGIAREPATIQSDKPSRGDGITQAVRQAFTESGLTIYDTAYRLADLNGEHYKFKEAIFAEGRFMNRRYEGFYDLWHPIECTGEIGAANAPCILAVAFLASQKRYAPGDTTLCHFSNDDGERAALIVRFQR